MGGGTDVFFIRSMHPFHHFSLVLLCFSLLGTDGTDKREKTRWQKEREKCRGSMEISVPSVPPPLFFTTTPVTVGG
jgi:hypothetical protein